MPKHLAIIMDGNGRWAEERGRPRIDGHRHGVERVREITEASGKRGIRDLTLFAPVCATPHRPRGVQNCREKCLRYVGCVLKAAGKLTILVGN